MTSRLVRDLVLSDSAESTGAPDAFLALLSTAQVHEPRVLAHTPHAHTHWVVTCT